MNQAGPPDGGLARARADLQAAGVPAGVLIYADEACRLHTVTLPDLSPYPGPEGSACRFRSTVGNELAFGGPARSPGGVLTPHCRDGHLELRLPDGGLYARGRGCGIAWRPDKTPTFIRDGEVTQFSACPHDRLGSLPVRCSRTILSRTDLAREFRRARWTGVDFLAEEIHWLDNRRFAAIVRARSLGGAADLLVVFENRRLVSHPLFAYDDLSGIRPSPSGGLVSARIVDPGGIVTVDRDGEHVRLALRHGDAVTWSPDERWIAEATADGIYIFRSGDDSPSFVHLPIVVRDLAWR